MQGRFACQAPHSWHLVTYTLISPWHAVWHNLTSMTPAVDHDYIPGMITSHRAWQKEFAKFAASPERVQNITLVSGSMESTPSLRGLCHKRSFREATSGKKPSEPGGARRRRVRHFVRPSVQHTPLDFRGKHILFLFWPSVTSHYLVEETTPPCKTNGQVTI